MPFFPELGGPRRNTAGPSWRRSSAYRDVLLAEKPDVSVLSQSMQTVLLELIVALARPGQCLLVFLPGIGEGRAAPARPPRPRRGVGVAARARMMGDGK